MADNLRGANGVDLGPPIAPPMPAPLHVRKGWAQRYYPTAVDEAGSIDEHHRDLDRHRANGERPA